MTFLWLPLLFAVALVPLGVLIARRIDQRRRRRMVALTGLGWTGGGGAGTGGAVRRASIPDRIPAALTVAAFALFAIALARPQASIPVPRAGPTRSPVRCRPAAT